MKTILAALAALVCVAAPIGTATGPASLADCPLILIPPFSGEDINLEGDLRDSDGDGWYTENELGGSDPTDRASTPLDRDGDGVPAHRDSCDTDPAQS